MNGSKYDSKNYIKQDANGASATTQPTPEANKTDKTDGAGSEVQTPETPGVLAKDKDLSQQGAQSHKTDRASSDESGSAKDAAADEGNQATDGTPSGSNADKTGEASPGLSAKSKA
jgi:hypothetical protein